MFSKETKWVSYWKYQDPKTQKTHTIRKSKFIDLLELGTVDVSFFRGLSMEDMDEIIIDIFSYANIIFETFTDEQIQNVYLELAGICSDESYILLCQSMEHLLPTNESPAPSLRSVS